MQDQRRQREIIHELGFIRSVSEIGEVLRVRDVCFGDEQNVWRDLVQDFAQELDDAMRLRQMDAGSADLFPKISDGVQSDEARALFDVKEQSTYNGQQHVRLFEVQVHLVRAESCPHFFPSRAGGKFREQRERAWPHNLRE